MCLYRKTSRQERTVLRRAFSKWDVFEYFKDESIYVRTNKVGQKQIFFLPSEIMATEKQPLYAGLLIGELGKQFSPSIQMSQIIAKEGKNFPSIKVNSKGETMVIYGRDVFVDSIVENNSHRENEMVIILNERNEAIGIGRTRNISNHRDMNTNKVKIAVTTIADIGQYLREEDSDI
jgi:ribosome biogenesis protein Nip4